ncbi:MAG: TssA family type VI secretion system protein [Nannocystaceae bacterium]
MTTLQACIDASVALTAAASTRAVSGDPRYQQLRDELDRGHSPTGDPIAWETIAALGEALLQGGGLDLLVAAYTTVALLKTRGAPGLVIGLEVVDRLLGDPWPTISPPLSRLRSRAAALKWLVDRLAVEVGPSGLQGADRGLCEHLPGLARRVRDHARERLGDQAPAFGELVRGIDAMRPVETPPTPTPPSLPATEVVATPAPTSAQPSSAAPAIDPTPPTPAPAPAPAPPPSATPAPVALTPAPAVAAPSGDGAGLEREVDRNLRRLGDSLIETASALRRADPTDPRAFRLLRQGLWLHMHRAPPAKGGRATIPGVDDRDRAKLDALEERQAWAELVELGEALIVRQRLALDLHHRVARALAHLGARGEEAARAVADGARELVRRLPELVELRGADDRPLADPQTRSWLSQGTGSSRAGGKAPSAARAAAIADTDADADASGPRQTFAARLAAAEEALAGGSRPLAAALFAGLAAEVDRHDLDRWEPGLAGRVLAGVARTQGLGEPTSPLAIRLAALDPEAFAAVVAG